MVDKAVKAAKPPIPDFTDRSFLLNSAAGASRRPALILRKGFPIELQQRCTGCYDVRLAPMPNFMEYYCRAMP